MSSRRRYDADQNEIEVSGPLLQRSGGHDQHGLFPAPQAQRTWIAYAMYFAIVLIVGMSLEVVHGIRTVHMGCVVAVTDDAGLRVLPLVDPSELPTLLYASACMIVAVVLVLVDLVLSHCYKSRQSFDPIPADRCSVGICISISTVLRSFTILFVVLLGAGTLAYVINQCGIGFVSVDCLTCHYRMMMVLRVYLVTKCVFGTGLIVYFWMLVIANTALFSNSRLNVLMVHHLVATTLYLCLRTAAENYTFVYSAVTGIGNSKNNTCTLDSSTWVNSYFFSDTGIGTTAFNPVGTGLGLLFVAYYIDMWKTYKGNRSSGRRRPSVNRFSGIGFYQLRRLFTNYIRDRSGILLVMIAQSILFVSYVGSAVESISYSAFSLFSMYFPRSYSLAIAFLMICLVAIALAILRKHVVVERSVGPLQILLLFTLPGELCDKIFKVVLYSSHTLSPSLSLELVEQILLMIQSMFQVYLILYALKREGRHGRICCGTTPLSHVLDTLTVLNLGMLYVKEYEGSTLC
jgi:hypothetical protein